jgi:myo-inositol-1(or 4)-monophosphatase
VSEPADTTPDPVADPASGLGTELLDIALEAAWQAGALLRDGRPEGLGVAATKSSPVDVVTEMDTASEKMIFELISARRPADGFLGEEGASSAGTSGVRWVVDPLDGTVNYLYGLPSWGVSIAAQAGGRTVAAVVAVPARGETFHGLIGAGAYLNGRRIRCRTAPAAGQALVATGFNYVRSVRDHQAEVVRALIPEVRDIRRGGAAAVDLCDVACGRLDAYYERGLHPWDMAAGLLIAAEAGTLSGGRPGEQPSGELAVVGVPGAFEPLQALLEELGAWHD